MHNFYTIEIEAESRRQERERSAADDARAAQAYSPKRQWSWFSRAFQPQASQPTRTPASTPAKALLELPRVPRPVAG